MTKLNLFQSELLAAAAAAGDAGVPAPTTSKAAVRGLINRGLAALEPREQGPDQLLITEAGKAEIAQADGAGPQAEPAAPPAPESAPSAPKGKIGVLISLLEAPDGATIETMMTATGWQAHSVRGAIAGTLKKKCGLAVTSDKTEAGRVYRITRGGAA